MTTKIFQCFFYGYIGKEFFKRTNKTRSLKHALKDLNNKYKPDELNNDFITELIPENNSQVPDSVQNKTNASILHSHHNNTQSTSTSAEQPLKLLTQNVNRSDADIYFMDMTSSNTHLEKLYLDNVKSVHSRIQNQISNHVTLMEVDQQTKLKFMIQSYSLMSHIPIEVDDLIPLHKNDIHTEIQFMIQNGAFNDLLGLSFASLEQHSQHQSSHKLANKINLIIHVHNLDSFGSNNSSLNLLIINLYNKDSSTEVD